MKQHRIYLVSGIIFSILVIITALTVVHNRSSTVGRATDQSTYFSSVFSKDNSYIFASPITASADGESIIRVTVFLLDNQGLGVSGQRITLSTAAAVSIEPISPVTDQIGKAIFDLSSQTRGDYTINASVANVSLPQAVSVSFQ